MMNVVNVVKSKNTLPLYPFNRFSVAPMLDRTDKHCRYFHRLLTQQTLLYSEMVTTGAILFGKGDYLSYNDQEHPIALQLGGSDPQALAQCAVLAHQYHYDEINLNIGCPSDRVQNGKFGACLMAEAELVARCVDAMQQVVPIPVTVKTRLGIDHLDSYTFIADFIHTVAPYCTTFIIHARKAWLSGLSPKENRDIPPLDYARVYQLKQDFPHLNIAINGGIHTVEEAKNHLQFVDGVMIGRAAYQNPEILLSVDSQIFGEPSRFQHSIDVVEALYPYIEQQLSCGVYLNHITRHLLGLFQNMRGAKQWRRYLSEHAHCPGADVTTLENALFFIKNNNGLC